MRIMVVDDEAPIKDYIADCIRQAGAEHTLVASVSRAAQVLERLRHDPVDLVLTDITMPRMDGLALLQEIKANWPGIDVVMLTCHDDFGFARTAMQHGATDYILKSEITPASTRALLDRLAQRRVQEVFRGGGLHAAQYLCRVLFDSAVDLLPEESLRQHQLPESGHCFALMFKYSKPVLDALALRRAVWLAWQVVFSCEGGRIALLACPQRTMDEREQRAQITALHNDLQRLTDTRIGLSELHYSMPCAKRALAEALHDADRTFYCEPGAGTPLIDQEEKLAELFIMRNNAIAAMSGRDIAELRRQIDKIFAFSRAHQLSVSRLKRLLNTIVGTLLGTTPQNDVQRMELRIADAEHLEELKRLLEDFVDSLESGSVCYSANIEQALAYIHEHFRENITLQDVAQSAYLNTEYCSRRFKQEVGVNFTEYLLSLRLEEAHTLLRQTNLRVGEVAEQVGIGNVSYFSMVYKKQFGTTPNESRKR